jgi:hypothetical protein
VVIAMANTPMQSVRQSDTDNAPTTAPVVITPLSYFRKDSVSVLLAQLDGAESRTVFGKTVVVFPNELLNATSEELEDVLQEKAKAILFGTLTVNGVTMTVETAAKWYCTTISNGNKDAKQYAKEVFYRPIAEVQATYANYVNFNELNLDGGEKAYLCLVSKEDYAKAEEIQAFFANNGLNLSRGDYLSNGTGSVWTINKYGIVLS